MADAGVTAAEVDGGDKRGDSADVDKDLATKCNV